ncbi:MAG TPA: DUF1842 domain-containing protein [Pyrinomonadaceae bacterium]|nr:DUF1842 domain-containing protein [Pyrinomonadaceae bacterium]
MSTPTPVEEPLSESIVFHRNYRSEALQPGGAVMNAHLVFPGRGAYGSLVGYIRLQQSGVQPPGDDLGEFTVKGMYAFLGGKPGEVITVSFDSIPSPVGIQQIIHGQMSLTNDWKTGHATFSYREGERKGSTVHNAKVNLVR